jgi:hypothetical protein
MTMTQTISTSHEYVDRIRALRSEKRQSVSAVMREVRAGYFGTDTDVELDAAMDDMFDDVIETLDAAAAHSKGADHIGRMSEGYPS